MTLAFTEPSARFDAEGVELRAEAQDGKDYVLNGTKLFIPDAHVADTMVVVARTERQPARRGLRYSWWTASAAGAEQRRC